ncbi:ADP-ribosylglycohydrolase family protein [Baaleninema simplex]|uniref:ADP-ribosylglycohydrolase family protein n=1 Tax=Baaleninema simplex TaxID=2862350 RepID=UPI00034A61AC|nr:ADP-ribosylglycohydrolase family protein [Baaleninema simplex]
MYLSLLERFRGTLLGAELGYRLSCSPDDPLVWMGDAEREAAERFVRCDACDLVSVSETPLFGALLVALLLHDRSDRASEAIASILNPPSVRRPEALAVMLTVAAAVGDRLAIDSLSETFAQEHLDPDVWLTPTRQRLDGVRLRGREESVLSVVLYCVLSAEGDWELAVRRSGELGRDRTLAGTLAGALCGAWRTRIGVPAIERATLDNRDDLDAIAWLVWQRWAGRLEFQPWDGSDRVAWGASGTLRPRRSRRSQPPRLS